MSRFSLDDLNPAQRQAVEHLDTPVLVLAGAGSGKTRVLTYKIGHLIALGRVRPQEILAVTFTNKAASEMKKRVEQLLERPLDGLWIGTFHSICARILRMEADRLGYDRTFTIYDVDDQVRLIQQVMTSLNIPQDLIKPRQVQWAISDAKNQMVSVEKYEQLAVHHKERQIARVYREYQNQLHRHNAFDFDDLLLKPLDLFTRFDDVRQRYQSRFRYILVDEYQDTNKAQYYLVKLLSEAHQQICVVGDEDQSIYRWRGADIENILRFEKDFPKCETVRLEQNYRSTQTILDAANAVVANNQKRLGKNLWSDRAGGPVLQVVETLDESGESRQVAQLIRDAVQRNGLSYNDVAVLYRTNAQSRALEDRLRRLAVPYTIVGGVKFYDRKEVKDVLAYLRVLSNARDEISLRRIINYPSRGIGNVSVERLERFATEAGMPMAEALLRVGEIEELTGGARKKIYDFGLQLRYFREQLETASAYEIAMRVVQEFGLLRAYEDSSLPDDEVRRENIQELLNSIATFVENAPPDEAGLSRYLEDVALLTDIDRWDPDFEAVTLMTLHSAKGLEFPVVVLTGMEDGLFPLSRAADDPDDLEEERRLFYVGMTRAKDELYLTWARQRRRFSADRAGMSFNNVPSRFLIEIPESCREEKTADGYSGGARSWSRRRGAATPGASATPGSSAADRLDSAAASGYQIGDWVIHESFGKGQVLGVDASPAGTKLTIVFARKVVKKIIAEYANLRRGDD